MTHDLIKNIIENLNASLTEVYINDLLDGTFYAKLIFSDLGLEIDARPSDAIAIAVRCNVPIYVSEEILEETAIIDSFGEDEQPPEDDDMPYAPKEAPKKSESRVEMLQRQLDEAIKKEEYEKAAQIRDELKRILESS